MLQNGNFSTPSDVVEDETCASLVGLLGQLADLVDHSSSVFAGLHNQIEKVNKRCNAAQQRCKALSERMSDYRGVEQIKAFSEAYIDEAVAAIVPAPMVSLRKTKGLKDKSEAVPRPHLYKGPDGLRARFSRKEDNRKEKLAAPLLSDRMPSAPLLHKLEMSSSKHALPATLQSIEQRKQALKPVEERLTECSHKSIVLLGEEVTSSHRDDFEDAARSRMADTASMDGAQGRKQIFTRSYQRASDNTAREAGTERRSACSAPDLASDRVHGSHAGLQNLKPTDLMAIEATAAAVKSSSFTHGLEHLIYDAYPRSLHPGISAFQEKTFGSGIAPHSSPMTMHPIYRQSSSATEDEADMETDDRILVSQIYSTEAESVTARSLEAETPVYRKKDAEMDAAILESHQSNQIKAKTQGENGEFSDPRESSEGEDLAPETGLDRTLTGDTIEGQIFPTHVVPLLPLQRPPLAPVGEFSPLSQGLTGMQHPQDGFGLTPPYSSRSHVGQFSFGRVAVTNTSDTPSARSIAPRAPPSHRSSSGADGSDIPLAAYRQPGHVRPVQDGEDGDDSHTGRDEECTLEGLRDNDSDAHYDRDMSQEQCHSQWPVQSASDNHLDAKYNRSMSKTQFRPPSPVYSANDNHLDSQNGRGVSKLQFCPQSPVDSARSSQSFGMAWDEQENAAISNTFWRGRGGPVFMRNKEAGSPVFPPELILQEGPLATALPTVAQPLRTTNLSALDREPEWGESRYVLPGLSLAKQMPVQEAQPELDDRGSYLDQAIATPRVPRVSRGQFMTANPMHRPEFLSCSLDSQIAAQSALPSTDQPMAYAADGYLGSRHVKDLHSPTKPVSMQRPVFSTQRPRDTSPALHRGYYDEANLGLESKYPESRRHDSSSSVSYSSLPSNSLALQSAWDSDEIPKPITHHTLNPNGVFPRRFGLAPYSAGCGYAARSAART